MLCKKEKRNYVILFDGERFPEKANIKLTDESLQKLLKSFEDIRSVMKELYDKDYTSYKLLFDNCLEYVITDGDDGRSWKLKNAVESLHDLKDFLNTHDDEIKPEEEVITLTDLGFRLWTWDKSMCIFEKIVEDTEEHEVVEEVLSINGKPLYRTRTTEWEKTDYGRSSTSIKYKKLRLTKKIEKAFYNSLKEYEDKISGRH